MKRVLLLATTTGYQTRSFGEAAERLRVELVFATDRCHLLEDPWQDHAIPIRFYDEDTSVEAIVESARRRPIDGVMAVGDRPTVVAARVAQALDLPGHPPAAAAIARHKLLTRERLRDAGFAVPWFVPVPIHLDAPAVDVPFPCVLKPMSLSGSRGVMRADDPAQLDVAMVRLRSLLTSPEIRAERDGALEEAIIEGFIPGREYAVEGLMHRGRFQLLALFDKPDPLDGPFFEETIYLTPSSSAPDVQEAIVDTVARAAVAIGLFEGPVHAECRVNRSAETTAPVVFVLEVAARPIGGLCARSLRFRASTDGESPAFISLEELLLRQSLGEDPSGWTREASAAGVMMIPIPRRGIYRGVSGVEVARQVPHVEDVRITAKLDQLLVPLPEGASYLGFIFARARRIADVESAIRGAHGALSFRIHAEFPLLASGQVHYNLQHG